MAKKTGDTPDAGPERYSDTTSMERERTGRGVGFILSAVFIAAIFVAGVIALIFSKIGDDSGPALAPPPAAPHQHTEAQPNDERPTCTNHRDAFSNIVFDAFGTRAQVPVNGAGQLLAEEPAGSKPTSGSQLHHLGEDRRRLPSVHNYRWSNPHRRWPRSWIRPHTAGRCAGRHSHLLGRNQSPRCQAGWPVRRAARRGRCRQGTTAT